MIRKFLAAALVAAVFALPAAAQDSGFNDRQREDIERVVRAYLMKHPEVIAESIEALREKMRLSAEADAKKMIEAHAGELFRGSEDPVAGNPKGDVVLVEFFDYNCGFCRQTMETMFDAAKADGKVKIVFKEYPILSEDSEAAAKVALAARKLGKYEEVHRAFMKHRGPLDEKTAYRLAADVGLAADQLKKEANSPDIAKQLRKNRELAHALDIGSTPTWVIGDRIQSGAVEAQVFKQMFDITRKGGKLPQQ
ncbi:MAG: DsbA family protein [Magnetospirillum sp.]|nr:DsbA family protein [Magnetospirillum sp.]